MARKPSCAGVTEPGADCAGGGAAKDAAAAATEAMAGC